MGVEAAEQPRIFLSTLGAGAIDRRVLTAEFSPTVRTLTS
jgi:hypothetical protein